MSDEHDRDAVQRLLGMLAEHLQDYFEGDELALESLGGAIEEGDFTADQAQAAVLTLRSLTGGRLVSPEVAGDPPGRGSSRVLNDQERGSLSPEAWGYLLDLKRRGSLDSGQVESVLDRLAASGVRPVGVQMAHEMAVRVALSGAGAAVENAIGENEIAH